MKKVLFSQQPPRLTARPGDAPTGGQDGPIDPEAIAITESAATEIKRQATQRGAAVPALRLGIKGGGCTGFSYLFDWADGEPRETDKVFSAHGVSVYVDPKSFKLLKGTQLDFTRSLMGYGFKFNNPNAKGTCGCGESVQF